MILESTKKAIIRYCEYQERCHSEVRTKLYELGCYAAEADEYISEMIEIGLVNEERFARAYARGKFRMKQWGKDKIKQQLKLKKISDFCIKKALTEINAEEYDHILQKLVDKKLRELKSEKNQHILKGKVFRYMVQKGYEKYIIIDLINDGLKKRDIE